ncbi:hypothetical protein [Candidatus Pantoea multigeneris]|uniref:Uncharacterized protein n=1 Tax=Candidatus Pantoea multigeneris TaxID=2608357 RepID=A0ABX0RFJ1_9GAMM|nr:hypothetical protein [Pantoea multigeneris]NIF22878.1 hypothetical protein [Pantoea multigeneris]
MSSEFLDPATSLENFFILSPALAFHDQREDSVHYSYARASVDLVTTTGSSKTSSLKLTTSTAGGLATFVVPNLSLDQAPLKNYIRQHFLSGSEQPVLALQGVTHAVGLRFLRAEGSHCVPFEENRMPLTHAESEQLAGAIQGQENKVLLQTTSEFIVQCKSSAELTADWIAVLHQAFNEDKKQREQLELLLEQLITTDDVKVIEEYANSPAAETRDKAKKGVITLAALSLASTLRNISDASQIPDEVDYEFTQSNSYPQRYLLRDEIDIAPILGYLPYNSIVSVSKTPLPEPDRTEQPGEEKQCQFILNVDPVALGIAAVTLRWGEDSLSLSWPLFPPATITASAATQKITLEITYGDYNKFTTELDWDEHIFLEEADIGWHSIIFDARQLSGAFKSITGEATYIPASAGVKKNKYSISFSNQIWSSEWLLNTYSREGDGYIEYSWKGKPNGLFPIDYDSGLLKATSSPITLQYK